jgi:YD repeat-containing protein
MQQIFYDARGEHVAWRSVPVSEGTAESELVYDAYEHDAAGREVQHTTPWSAVVKTAYDGLRVETTDPLLDRASGEHRSPRYPSRPSVNPRSLAKISPCSRASSSAWCVCGASARNRLSSRRLVVSPQRLLPSAPM